MALGEVDMPLPRLCYTLVLPPPGYWGLYLNLIIFSQWKNGQFQRSFRSKLKVVNFSNFTLWNRTFFRVSTLTYYSSETGQFSGCLQGNAYYNFILLPDYMLPIKQQIYRKSFASICINTSTISHNYKR